MQTDLQVGLPLVSRKNITLLLFYDSKSDWTDLNDSGMKHKLIFSLRMRVKPLADTTMKYLTTSKHSKQNDCVLINNVA